MKSIIIFFLLISTATFAGPRKCREMYGMAAHTLKMAEFSAETAIEYKHYVAGLYTELESEDRNSDSFPIIKTNLCKGVEDAKKFWQDSHQGLEAFLVQLDEMINYRGCKKRLEELNSLLNKVESGLVESRLTLNRFIEFYNYNIDPELNCPL